MDITTLLFFVFFSPKFVAEGLIKLLVEGHNGQALRVTHEKGLDFASFEDAPIQ
jgi:hypothetical protein